jgi:hypothetical protein
MQPVLLEQAQTGANADSAKATMIHVIQFLQVIAYPPIRTRGF